MSAPEDTPELDLAALVRGEGEAPSGDVAAGAEALRADLESWTAPEPPADLIQRTLAKIALAPAEATEPAAAPEPVAEPEPVAAPAAGGGALEVLTTQPFAPTPHTKRRGLIVRLFTQALAACLLFGVSASFTAFFYPAVVHALEEGRLERCQQRLKHLARALNTYRAEHPGAEPLSGGALRRALIEGGYASPGDFVCPGAGGDLHGSESYVGTSAIEELEQPVFWDRFGNHPQGFNVVYGDARVELLDVNDFQFKPERERD